MIMIQNHNKNLAKYQKFMGQNLKIFPIIIHRNDDSNFKPIVNLFFLKDTF